MKIQNDQKQKGLKKKKNDTNRKVRNCSKSSEMTNVEFSNSKTIIKEDLMTIICSEEQSQKREKRYPEEQTENHSILDVSFACNEKFETSNYAQLKGSPITLKKAINNNIIMSNSNSSTFQNSQYLSENHNIIINLEKSFQFTQDEIDLETMYDLNQEMVSLEENYFSERVTNFLMKKQKFINPQMRGILLNWILEVSAQLGFKRETYHLSVFLIDRFLQMYENLQTGDFQLLGVTCLMISSKFEEIFNPRVELFSHLTEDAYPVEMIIKWEHLVLRVMNWRITYNTLATWSNIFLAKWDDFVSMSQTIFSHLETTINIALLPVFRYQANNNYCLFRNFFQILDLITLNVNSGKYKERSLVLAVMYLNIGLWLEVFNIEKVAKYFPLHSQVLTQYSDYNCIFREFMNIQIGLDFCDILECIQYASRFFVLKFDYSSPYTGDGEKNVHLYLFQNNYNYEEFLQIQTFNPHLILTLNAINKKFGG